MSYLNDKIIENIVVPVYCESQQGTAFFINKTQLLTARHIVKAHFQSVAAPEAIKINVSGQLLLCKGEELHLPESAIDLALLTIVSDTDYNAQGNLSLLCDEYVEGMPLRIYGYPREIAMGCNLVTIKVRNRLNIPNGVWGNRTLIREDDLLLHNYDGLSGAPVVTNTGRVIGVIVVQINETLNYLSVSQIKEHLKNKGINYSTDWEIDDITPFGIGSSHKFCKDKVSALHDRYMPKLHQRNKTLEQILDNFSHKKLLDESHKNVTDLADLISQLPANIMQNIQRKLKINQPLSSNLLIKSNYSLLKRCHNYLRNHSMLRSLRYQNLIFQLNELTNKINQEDFERLDFLNKSNLCIVGKAGSGKTHSLCEYALNNQDKANIYLFIGTEFNISDSPIKYIQKLICQDKTFEDFNQELKSRNRYAIIVIDAINEGLGCRYWNNTNLGSLRVELEKYDYIKLIVSVRKPFDKEINDLTDDKWHVYEINGFVNKNEAIEAYFSEYQIPQQYKGLKIEAFKNPLFLKMFCETFHSLPEQEIKKVTKLRLYKTYVANKNEKVTDLIDEDPELNIADKYLSKLANYSVFYGHFNPINRQKARKFAQQIAPYRLWDKDLLHACLTANLLLNDRSHIGEPSVMFEYENLGDYYKAEELLRSKMDIKGIFEFIDSERKFLERNTLIPSEKFITSIKALFDCWYHAGIDIYNEKLIQKGGALYEHYYDFLMESDVPDTDIVPILLKLDNDAINPLLLIQKFNELTLTETYQIHKKLKEYPSVGSRDLIWTRHVNQLYERYEDDFIAELSLNEDDYSLELSDEKKQYLICITWMLSSSHPKVRALIIRKLKHILDAHNNHIIWLIELFKDVNDPYVLGGLYCSICGIILPSRNRILATNIAKHIYKSYYENDRYIPQDLIVRQWTLKIIERAYYLDNSCNYWKLIKTPFKPQQINKSDVMEYNSIESDIFGVQRGSIKMYNSLFQFEDFNRYIIGNNYRHLSNDYFLQSEDGNYKGVPLNDIMAEMAYYIKNIFGWNDKLGYLDNGKYSYGRTYNEKERIGKKFQWLAWYRVNAHLMDIHRTSKQQYYYSDDAEEKDLTRTPYPWNCSEISRFDPTLTIKEKYVADTELSGIEIQPINNQSEDWIENNSLLPIFRNIAIHNNGDEYVLLMGYDKSYDIPKETFLFINSCFVKENDSMNFENWAKDQNFYGRWMPERQGMIEFFWNDYPWADVYKSTIDQEVWVRAGNCPCDFQVSYEAQLQENWEGINKDEIFLMTVYMPCVEIMEQMELYCSETRGIIKDKYAKVAAINTENEKIINGLFIRRDILNNFLNRNGYVMYYYVLGEKVLRIDEGHSNLKDLSASYKYSREGDVAEIQPMRVIEREKPENTKNTTQNNDGDRIPTSVKDIIKFINSDVGNKYVNSPIETDIDDDIH